MIQWSLGYDNPDPPICEVPGEVDVARGPWSAGFVNRVVFVFPGHHNYRSIKQLPVVCKLYGIVIIAPGIKQSHPKVLPSKLSYFL